MTAYCSECFRSIDKKYNVGKDNKIVICDICTMIRCAGVPKEKILARLPKGNNKWRKRK